MIEVLERVRVPRSQGGRPRTRPDHVGGDQAYSSRRNRRYLRRRQIKHTIPEPKDQRPTANAAAAGADFRAVATRYDNRAYVFHGTVATAAIRLRLRL